jgi:hypothetical protein
VFIIDLEFITLVGLKTKYGLLLVEENVGSCAGL